MQRKLAIFFLLSLAMVFIATAAAGQGSGPDGETEAQVALGTAFTYQGRLTDGGSAANGVYDFRFLLYDAANGSQVGSTVARNDIAVADGLFSVPLDFGNVFTGEARYLEVQVRPGSSSGAYTVLTPRQALTPAPQALALPNVFTSGANVGIGTTAPGYKLDVVGNRIRVRNVVGSGGKILDLRVDGNNVDVNATNADLFVYANGGNTIMQPTSGRVGIGTESPAFKLDVAGAAHASSFPTSSDARLKTNILPVTGVLDRLEAVRVVSFDWNRRYQAMGRATGHREIGVIAQDVEAVFPELVTTWGEDGYRAVDYGRMAALLIEATKELRAEQEGEIADLKAENADLEARIAALEAMVAQLAEQQDGGRP